MVLTKVNNSAIYTEEVLFNSDTLSKIISYLPSIELLNLALTSKRFGISITNDEPSLMEESIRIAIQDIATEEQLATLPYYNGQNSLANYHYLQFMRGPLTFDQLVGGVERGSNGDKSCVTNSLPIASLMTTGVAFSNSIMRAGKHYATFTTIKKEESLMLGVMRPGKASENARGLPIERRFYQNFSRYMGYGEHNNNVNCCFYDSYEGVCFSSDWSGSNGDIEIDSGWSGMQQMSSGDEIGLLLDLDEGTLTVYKNGRKLGVMKSGLAGPYCWVVSLFRGVQVTIKRGKISSS